MSLYLQHFLRFYPMKYQYLVVMNGYNIIMQNVVILRYIDFFPPPLKIVISNNGMWSRRCIWSNRNAFLQTCFSTHGYCSVHLDDVHTHIFFVCVCEFWDYLSTIVSTIVVFLSNKVVFLKENWSYKMCSPRNRKSVCGEHC